MIPSELRQLRSFVANLTAKVSEPWCIPIGGTHVSSTLPRRASASVELYLVHFPTDPEGSTQLSCLTCDEPLSLHQPDADLPERLLGTCDGCGAWFLIDLVPGTDEAVMVLLPKGGYFRDAIGAEVVVRIDPIQSAWKGTMRADEVMRIPTHVSLDEAKRLVIERLAERKD